MADGSYQIILDVGEYEKKAMQEVVGLPIESIYNISTTKETSIIKLAEELIRTSDVQVKIKRHPSIKGEQLRSCLSNKKAKRELNWSPKYDLDQGLQITWNYFRNL